MKPDELTIAGHLTIGFQEDPALATTSATHHMVVHEERLLPDLPFGA